MWDINIHVELLVKPTRGGGSVSLGAYDVSRIVVIRLFQYAPPPRSNTRSSLAAIVGVVLLGTYLIPQQAVRMVGTRCAAQTFDHYNRASCPLGF